ncbi:hypothetical protein M422DRAFT_28609 [Sphaerobolus stellatus SS14]|uniref:Uncharacterized protein n=1 Tax=Sphaerobolus stellatus (strain SS14) TaxID=990650 RepID=A0A0C9W5T2_SPHS4|nr:hypothetical protein M422DRAFT_28609 [Sphaerobolus stellatus SS14]
MSLPHKITFWKKASRKKGPGEIAEGRDWIASTLQVTKLTIEAGNVIPGMGGLIKGAAGAFVTLLEPVQQMGKNKDDCKLLITSITQVLETVNKELKTIPLLEGTTLDTHSKVWYNLERSLENTKERLVRLNSESRFFPRYLRANKIRYIISSYETEMQRLQIIS